MKLNLANMIKKFTQDTWYQIDLLVDWDNQEVTIYVNTEQLGSDIFFTDKKKNIIINSTNAVLLYNLAPDTTCRIRKLQICEDRC
jgi:hypothetical protein